MSENKLPKVSIITPTRNNLEILKKCYESIIKNTEYNNWEWVIGDSASNDGTANYINGLNDYRIKIIERNTTEGSYSSINNEIVKFSDGEYLVFLNDDTEPQKEWMSTLLNEIIKNQNIGVVGNAPIAFKDPAGFHNDVAAAQVHHKQLPEDFFKINRLYQAVGTSCAMMRRADFDAVNGFTEIYYFGFEDIDLCLKILYNLNKKVLYVSNCDVFHIGSVSQNKYINGQLKIPGIRYFYETWWEKIEKDANLFINDASKGLEF